jgi:hypothetical protein
VKNARLLLLRDLLQLLKRQLLPALPRPHPRLLNLRQMSPSISSRLPLKPRDPILAVLVVPLGLRLLARVPAALQLQSAILVSCATIPSSNSFDK